MHLTRDALLLLAESPGPPDHPHVATCARCRAEVDALRAVVRRLADDEVPEPSPLFWDHLSRRVRESIDGIDRAPVPAAWNRWPWIAYGAGAVAVVLALAVTVPRPLTSPAGGEGGPATAAMADGAATEAVLPLDEEWELVVDVASADAEGGDAFGTDLAPAVAEVGLQDLSSEERAALASLLREALEARGTEPGV